MNIEKSKIDNRNGYTYELPNKLKVIIFEDKDIDIACVSMLVKIGYFQDTLPGMAHFLEHMLFNGTEKYPDENLFSEHIAKYNGYSNAWTAHNHTCYYYTLSQNGLHESLKMFAEFFISPLLDKDCVNREKEAVNSEHKKNINNDNWRRQEILRAVAKDNHWFSKFGCGSNETLNCKDIHVKVREFFDKYYSSDLMILTVISNEPIEKIKKIIDLSYSNIKIKKINNSEIYTNNKILNTPSIIKFVPIEKEKKLIFVWEVDFYKNNPELSPIEFFTNLMNNQQKNSLYDSLIHKNFATSFYCYIKDVIYDKCLLCIDVSLTENGEKNKSEITCLIHNYIDIIAKFINKKELENLYNEYYDLAYYNFVHFQKSNCIDFVSEINGALANYDIDITKILLLNTLQDNYNNIKSNLKKLIKDLSFDNCVAVVCSDKYSDNKYSKKILEFPHYGTKYFVEDNKMINSKQNKTPNTFLKLPQLNQYISLGNKIQKFNTKKPILIKTENANIYYQQNSEYNTPNIIITLCIDIKLSLYDIYTFVCINLYLSSLIMEINDMLYLMMSALYNISLNYIDGNIYLKICGNYEKIDIILETLINNIINYDMIAEKTFIMTKTEMKKNCENDMFLNPYEKLPSLFKKQINKKYYESSEILNIIDKIALENIKDVFKKLFIRNNIIAFVSGNCNGNKFEEIKNTINTMPHKYHDFTDFYNKNIDIITKKTIKNIKNKNSVEENNANGYYIFINKYDYENIDLWIKEYCCLNLISSIIHTEYFDKLRTKEMFGYVVNGKIVQTGSKKTPLFFYCFTVQSSHKSTREMTERTDNFIKNFDKNIQNIAENEVEIIKQSFITSLLSKFNNLNEYSDYIFMNEIENGYLKYNLKETIADNCKNITSKDLIEFYKKKFLENDKILVLQLDKK